MDLFLDLSQLTLLPYIISEFLFLSINDQVISDFINSFPLVKHNPALLPICIMLANKKNIVMPLLLLQNDKWVDFNLKH